MQVKLIFAVILNGFDIGVIDAFGGCLIQQFLKDPIELGGMSDFVTENMGKLVEGNKQEHVIIIVFSVLISKTHVDFFLIDGIRPLILEEDDLFDGFGTNLFHLIPDMMELGIFGLEGFGDTAKKKVYAEDSNNEQGGYSHNHMVL